MFQLTDAILERIVFAMEDKQQCSSIADGDLVDRAEVSDKSRGRASTLYDLLSGHTPQGFTILKLGSNRHHPLN